MATCRTLILLSIKLSSIIEFKAAMFFLCVSLLSFNNPKIIFNFVDTFPISLQGLDFEIATGQTDYMVGVAFFKYSFYTIETL